MRYVDSREPALIKDTLRKLSWAVQKLDCGDFCFEEASGELVGVERKSIDQLLSDMTSGQLARQVALMCDAYRFRILLIEGHLIQRDGYMAGSKISWEQLWNALQSLQDSGVTLQLTTSEAHTIQRVDELADYYEKGLHSFATRRQAGDRRIAMLTCIPGIGEVRAKQLLERFGGIAALCQADMPALLSVDGFGPARAGAIRRFLQGGGK